MRKREFISLFGGLAAAWSFAAHALARGDHLAGAREPVLHPSASRRFEHQVGQNRLQPLDVGLSCLDCGVSLVTLGVGRNISGLRRLEFVAPLVHDLLWYVPVLDEHFSTVIIRSGKIQVALALRDESVS